MSRPKNRPKNTTEELLSQQSEELPEEMLVEDAFDVVASKGLYLVARI